NPGNGGLCLHTILPAGRTGTRSMHVAISTGGHYRSDDGGLTWTAMNRGIPASFQPDKRPEYGQCVHKIAGHPAAPGRLYAQNHGGDPELPMESVLRSDDDGASWQPITKGLP